MSAGNGATRLKSAIILIIKTLNVCVQVSDACFTTKRFTIRCDADNERSRIERKHHAITRRFIKFLIDQSSINLGEEIAARHGDYNLRPQRRHLHRIFVYLRVAR